MTILLVVLGLLTVLFAGVALRGAPYVPSHSREVEQAFTELYQLGKNDVLVDIGSGDGRVLRIASRCGARAVGYELNPLLVLISQWLSRRDQRATTQLADFWLVPFPEDTTVVYIFSVSRDNKKLARKLQREANRLGRSLSLITYGPALTHLVHAKKHRGHHLYQFEPLQTPEA